MSQAHPSRNYYPALDGLRGIGCLLIVVYHNFPFLHKYLFFGWLAMDIFFVLSGFLITDILLNSYGEPNYLKNFFVRRILRVFPLYYTTLVLFFFFFPLLPNFPLRLGYFLNNQAFFWTFTQNWLLIFKPADGQNVLGHLWSMGVEEQFYLLWPLGVALIRKPKTLLVVILTLFLGFAALRFWLWTQKIEDLSYFNFYLYTRIDGICLGCGVALLQKIDRDFLGKKMAVIVLAFALFNLGFYYLNLKYLDSFPYLGLLGFSTFSMIFALLVYEMVNHENSFFSKIFDIGILKFLGRISYGTYIFHWPLFLLIAPPIQRFLMRSYSEMTSLLITSIIASAAAYLLGFLSYRYFETHFLRLKRFFN